MLVGVVVGIVVTVGVEVGGGDPVAVGVGEPVAVGDGEPVAVAEGAGPDTPPPGQNPAPSRKSALLMPPTAGWPMLPLTA